MDGLFVGRARAQASVSCPCGYHQPPPPPPCAKEGIHYRPTDIYDRGTKSTLTLSERGGSNLRIKKKKNKRIPKLHRETPKTQKRVRDSYPPVLTFPKMCIICTHLCIYYTIHN